MTPIKLCVIGNSHAGMLVHAARAGAGAGLDLTYMARQGRGPEGLRLRGAYLRAMRPETRRALARLEMPDRVRIEDFDGFVVVAMTATVFSLAPMLAAHGVYDWPSMRQALGSADQGETAVLARSLVSEASLSAALVQTIEENIAWSVVEKIRRVSTVPIALVNQPFPSEDVMQGKSKQSAVKQLVRGEDGDAAARCLWQAHTVAFERFSALSLLSQPGATITRGCLTKPEYTRGAGRLDVAGRQPREDILHANAAYGALVLDQVRAAFSG